MKDYGSWTDLEVNKAVASLDGMGRVFNQADISNNAIDCYGSSGNYYGTVDYCNNPSDSWPIIQRNNIATQPRPSSEEWFAFSICESEFEVSDKNPLRAAMIVCLMMNEAEQ